MAFGCSFRNFPMVCQFLRVDPPLVFPESEADQTGSLGPGGLDLSKDWFHSCFQPLYKHWEYQCLYMFIYIYICMFIYTYNVYICLLFGCVFRIKHVVSTWFNWIQPTNHKHQGSLPRNNFLWGEMQDWIAMDMLFFNQIYWRPAMQNLWNHTTFGQ